MKKVSFLLPFLALILAQTSFADFTCESKFIAHDSLSPHCHLKIYLHRTPIKTKVCALDTQALRQVGEEECAGYCRRDQSDLQLDLENVIFQRIRFMERRIEEQDLLLEEAEGAYGQQISVLGQYDQEISALTKELKSEFKRAEESLTGLQQTNKLFEEIFAKMPSKSGGLLEEQDLFLEDAAETGFDRQISVLAGQYDQKISALKEKLEDASFLEAFVAKIPWYSGEGKSPAENVEKK